MSRLIDVDKFIEVLNDMPYIKGRYDKVNADEKFIFGCETVYEIVINMLEEQPTAFDVDKVVEHLEETREKDIPRINNTTTTRDEKVYKLAMSYAIDIVKAGGIDEI